MRRDWCTTTVPTLILYQRRSLGQSHGKASSRLDRVDVKNPVKVTGAMHGVFPSAWVNMGITGSTCYTPPILGGWRPRHPQPTSEEACGLLGCETYQYVGVPVASHWGSLVVTVEAYQSLPSQP